jgi:beta-lactamase superfamily II metal-dependent hydrolase
MFSPGEFLSRIHRDELVYFLCNVGDADAQVIVLPEDPETGHRRLMVVDVGATRKVPALLRSLAKAGLAPTALDGSLAPGAIALVVATHPHQDHIAGIPQVLREFGGSVAEFWDPGYFHTLPAYHEMMAAIEEQSLLLYAQPTSGLRRWIGNVAVTVLSPSIMLRNRFDSYGVEINDASISLRLEFPASRVIQLDEERNYIGSKNTQSLVLGADAQTLSWSYALGDFPFLQPSESAVSKALKMATGSDPLKGNVVKIPHHGSKHGINLELIERISPRLTLVSSVGKGGSYGFPHSVAQELMREALEPTMGGRGGKRHKDYELGIFYTSDVDDDGKRLGTIALVMGKSKITMWRFGDSPSQMVDFRKGRVRRS